MTKKIIKTPEDQPKKKTKKPAALKKPLVKKKPITIVRKITRKKVLKNSEPLVVENVAPKKIKRHNLLFVIFSLVGVIFSVVLFTLIKLNSYYDNFQTLLNTDSKLVQELFVNKLKESGAALDPTVSGMFNTNQAQPIWTQDDVYRGNLRAPVKIFYFADYNSQDSRNQEGILKKLVANYPDKIFLVRKDFPNNNQISRQEAKAARCAGEQKSFWEYHDILLSYLNREEVSQQDSLYNGEAISKSEQLENNRTLLIDLAERAQLDKKIFQECLDQGQQKITTSNISEGEALGIIAVPTVYVNGQQFSGSLSYDDLERLMKVVISK